MNDDEIWQLVYDLVSGIGYEMETLHKENIVKHFKELTKNKIILDRTYGNNNEIFNDWIKWGGW